MITAPTEIKEKSSDFIFSVISSSFSSFMQFDVPFLMDAIHAPLSVSRCSFVNVSHSSVNNNYLSSNYCIQRQKQELNSIECLSVQNPYSGCIVNRASSAFFCFNSSFLSSSTLYDSRQSFDNGSSVFDNSQFSVVSSETTNGGAIYLSGTAALSTSNCLFANCRLSHASSQAAAVFHSSTGNWICEFTKFENCSAQLSSGAFAVEANSLFVMHGCTVSNCSSSKSVGAGEISSFSECTLEDCKINLCKAIDGLAGALKFHFMSSTLTISFSLFEQNTAGTFGGALHFSSFEGEVQNANMKNCLFLSNSANEGNDMYAVERFAEYVVLTRNEVFSMSEEPRSVFAGMSSEDILNKIEDPFAVKADSSPIHVSERGNDWEGCGSEESVTCNCRTLKKGIERSNELGKMFLLLSGTYTTEQIVVLNGSISGSGQNPSQCEVTTDENLHLEELFQIGPATLSLECMTFIRFLNVKTLFLVNDTAGALILNQCVVSVGSGSNWQSFQRPQIYLALGKLYLKSCEFTGFQMEDSFVKIVDAKSEISNTTFLNMKRDAGDGCAVNAKLTAENFLVMQNNTLEQCKVNKTEGKGGGIYLDIAENSINNFSFNLLKFGANEAGYGNDIFVRSNDLCESVTVERFQKFNMENGSVLSLFGEEPSPFFEEPIDLLTHFLVQRKDSSIFVDHLGKDSIGCGDELYPCQSFQRATENLRQSSSGWNREIHIVDEVTMKETCSFSSLNIESMNDSCYAELYFDSNINTGSKGVVISYLDSLGFNRMHMNIPSCFSTSTTSLIGTEGNDNMSLELIKCSFYNQTNESITYPLLLIKSRTLIMDDCSLGAINLETNPFLLYGLLHVELRGFSITSVKLPGSPFFLVNQISAAHSESRGNSDFTPLLDFFNNSLSDVEVEGRSEPGLFSTSPGSSAVAESTVTFPMKINKCQMYYVSSALSEEGGVVLARLTRSGDLFVNDTTVMFCGSNFGGVGRGGFICVECPLENCNVEFCDLELKQNYAQIGSDVFISCKDLSEMLTPANFAFVNGYNSSARVNAFMGCDRAHFQEITNLCVFVSGYTDSTIYVDGENGFDSVACGREDFPCISIDLGLERIPNEGNAMLLLVNDSGLSSESVFDRHLIQPSKNSTLKFVVNGVISYENGVVMKVVTSSFNKFNFSIPETFTQGQTILIETQSKLAQINLNECFFKANFTGALPYVLLSIKDGQANITSCTFEYIKTSKALFEFHLSSKKSIGNLIMEQCMFYFLTQTEDFPAAISANANNEDTVRITNSSFHYCSANSSECGGAMLIQLDDTGEVELLNGSFAYCFASSGNGGGLFLRSISRLDELMPFFISTVDFNGNRALVGCNAFIKCYSVATQISDSQFNLRYMEGYIEENAICATDETKPMRIVDLMHMINVYRSDSIYISSRKGEGVDNTTCGNIIHRCATLNYGLSHLTGSELRYIYIFLECGVTKDVMISNAWVVNCNITSDAYVRLMQELEVPSSSACVMECSGDVNFEFLIFQFQDGFVTSHNDFIVQSNGSLSIKSCIFTCLNGENFNLNFSLVTVLSGPLYLFNVSIKQLNFSFPVFLMKEITKYQLDTLSFDGLNLERSLFCLSPNANLVIGVTNATNIALDRSSLIEITTSSTAKTSQSNNIPSIEIDKAYFMNISRAAVGSCIISVPPSPTRVSVINCSFTNHTTSSQKGQIASFKEECEIIETSFDGSSNEYKFSNNASSEDVCFWNGSLISLVDCIASFQRLTFANAAKGAITISGGNTTFAMVIFRNNNPFIDKYPSARRNVLCENSGILNLVNVSDDDSPGSHPSWWMLNEGCEVSGAIVAEQASLFFIPILSNVSMTMAANVVKLTFKGELLMPCNLSFRVRFSYQSGEQLRDFDFASEDFVSENEVVGRIPQNVISSAGTGVEVSAMLLFKETAVLTPTDAFVVKNRTDVGPGLNETDPSANKTDKKDDPDNKRKSNTEWSLVAFIVILVMFVAVTAVLIVFILIQHKRLVISEMKSKQATVENKQILEKLEKRIEEDKKSHEMREMSEMGLGLLSNMSSQNPLFIDDDLPDLPALEEYAGEEDLPDLPDPPELVIPEEGEGEENEVPNELEDPSKPQLQSAYVISTQKPYQEGKRTDLRSLYSEVHAAQGRFTLGTLSMNVLDGKSIVKSLAELFARMIHEEDRRVAMMARQLSPYTIFLGDEKENNVYVATEEFKEKKMRKELRRWMAPELQKLSKNTFDGDILEQSVVLTLGLILHELTTGEVPLSECDAEEAQEMLRDGVRPLTEGIIGEGLVELMEAMWKDVPEERMTLKEVVKKLNDIAKMTEMEEEEEGLP
ncbi:uncharacterized protein MONOS_14879 [Monocercomonoides exilis]|uniref:uncharacterized protein n=1 Tax=Monocercomonoides exilis TaxID=2049356 RepID=UPI00355992C0|nr:hypothetical protein MONOS_14879 [Monocercomonoides exilis]|eukprot:MONOS_14879.1-p1 / transcript=MONOS_14879.1 / gene=MONOS_14879 / organism=Monocercomonoides_exilis_PA203 / gene_product=unspecified product / transcript_product=unspecified product / location=Mono_scaffold01095:7704-14687(-) / protein_length=2327 / sequence_SO=supercontig / SO=protein_coding / is_pseudo=false